MSIHPQHDGKEHRSPGFRRPPFGGQPSAPGWPQLPPDERVPFGRAGRQRPTLDRSQVVRAALDIAATEGIDAVSMRRIARSLRVGTMSLYSHVPDKQTLIELMVDAVFGEFQPEPLTGDWRADATALAHRMRRLLLRHPWLPLLGSARPLLTPALYRNLLDYMEFSLSIYDGLGLKIEDAFAFDLIIDSYVQGFVAREQQDRAEHLDADGETKAFFDHLMPEFYGLLTDGTHPRLTAFMSAMQPAIFALIASGADISEVLRAASEAVPSIETMSELNDRHFTIGLECILDGIEARVAEYQRQREASPGA